MLESAQEKDFDMEACITKSQNNSSNGQPQQHAVLRKPLSLKAAGLDNIAPFSCFDVGTVTLEEADKAGSDPLDVFIPNYTNVLELSGRIRMPTDEFESSDSSSESSFSFSGTDEDEAEEHITKGDQAGEEKEKETKAKAIARPRTKAEQKELERAERAKAARVEEALLEGMSKEERQAYHAQKKAERLSSVNMSLDVYSKNRRRHDDDPVDRNARANAPVVNHSKIAINHLNT